MASTLLVNTISPYTGSTITVTPSSVTWSGNPTHSGTHTYSGVIKASAGLVGAPSVVSSGDATTGTWYPAAGTYSISTGGVERLRLSPGVIDIGAQQISMGSGVTSTDLVLVRDAANILALKNGTNAQEYRIYNTTTGSAYAGHLWSGGTYFIQTTAVNNAPMSIRTLGTGSLIFGTNSLNRWVIDGSTGHLIPGVNNSYDIGESSTPLKPRTIYAATSVVSPTVSATTAFNLNSTSLIQGMRGNISGLGLANNAGDATNDIDIAVGSAVDTSVTDIIFLSSALTKQLDVAWAVGTNQGMRATGVAIANGTYHIFLIRRPDTGVVDIAADTSATGANIATNTNAAYTQLRRIGSIMRESAAIVPFIQYGDDFYRKTPISDISVTNPGTSAVTRTLSVPVGVKVLWKGNLRISIGASGSECYLSSLDVTDVAADATSGAIVGGAEGVSSAVGLTLVQVWTNTSAQIRSRINNSDASTSYRLATHGWMDYRGRFGDL